MTAVDTIKSVVAAVEASELGYFSDTVSDIREHPLLLPPQIPADLEDVDDQVKASRSMAANEDVDMVALIALAADKDPVVRWLTALNRTTPPGVLDALAKDPDARVRREAARNPNLSDDSVLALSRDPEAEVRIAAIDSGLVPADRVERMVIDDPERHVQQYASTMLVRAVSARFGIPFENIDAIAAVLARNWHDWDEFSPEVSAILWDHPSA